MKTQKMLALAAGTAIGGYGYLYADHPDNGRYSIGLSIYEELFVVALFAAAAGMSHEPLSIFLLQVSVRHMLCSVCAVRYVCCA